MVFEGQSANNRYMICHAARLADFGVVMLGCCGDGDIIMASHGDINFLVTA